MEYVCNIHSSQPIQINNEDDKIWDLFEHGDILSGIIGDLQDKG